MPTIEILQHSAWAQPFDGSSWLSTQKSGDSLRSDFFEFANGTTITFSHAFNLPAAATGGSLSVRADDTSSVSLNGVLLFSRSTASGEACSSAPIGCLESTTGVLSFSDLEPHLIAGANVLSFAVHQVDGTAFGLSYAGSVTYKDPGARDVASPEPGSYLLSLTGLCIGALVARRRRVAVSL